MHATGELFASVTRGDAKLRYRSPAVPAAVEASADGFELALDSPVYGVARGQTAVVYEGDVVVGSGVVRASTAQPTHLAGPLERLFTEEGAS